MERGGRTSGNHHDIFWAFSITPHLPPDPQWFHIRFGNRWGALISWGVAPIQGEGFRAAELEVTYDRMPQGEIYGSCSPEKIVSLLQMLTRREP